MEPIRRTASRFLHSAGGRAILYQVAIVGTVLATLYAVTRRAVELLAERGVRSGFGFLSDRAGFHVDERILLPRLDPELFLFAGSVAVGVLAAWGLTRWAARRGTPAAADTRLAVLRVAVLFGIPAAALIITGSGIELEQFTSESTFRQALAVGILNTIRVSAVALVLSTIVGMIVALMRLSPNWVLRAIGRAYVELICNMPLLLHVFLWLAVLFSVAPERQSLSSGDVTFIDNRGVYLPAIDAAPGLAPFCIAAASALFLGWLAARLGRDHMERTGRRVPVLPISLALLVGLPGAAVLSFGAPLTYTLPVLERFNIRDAVVLTPAFVGLVVAMTVYYGAYAAEIIRTGIQSLRADVVEVAHAAARPRDRAMRLVVLPLVFREIIPPMVGRYLGLIRNSSLGVAVGYPEIVTVGDGIASATGQSIEILVLIMAFYLCISLSVSTWVNWYSARLRLKSAATEMPATREPSPSLPPHTRTLGPLEWVHRNLLSPWWNAVLTVAALWLCYQAIVGIYGWSVHDAAFLGGREACESVDGACWPFVADTWALFLVGIYPEDERWRPYLCFVLLFVLFVVSLAAPGRLRIGQLYAAWGAAPFVLVAILHGGDWVGLTTVPIARCGGLMLTILLSIIGIAVAFPLGALLALGRCSRRMPAVKFLCIAFIELIRGVPLITILYLAMLLVPLLVRDWIAVDVLAPALIGIILFRAAYLAEVVRRGLQAVPGDQVEVAKSPGFDNGRTMALVVLPQAMRIVAPAVFNQFVNILKDTSLLSIVGLLDLVAIARAAITNPEWFGMSLEAYVLVGLLYWILCFTLSRVSLILGERLYAQRC